MGQIFESRDPPLDLATTLRVPGFGANVVDGIEVVKKEAPPNEGLIPVNEESLQTTETSFQSIDCRMGNESSFYIHHGFCEGAKMMQCGEKDYYKIVQRPVVRKLKS